MQLRLFVISLLILAMIIVGIWKKQASPIPTNHDAHSEPLSTRPAEAVIGLAQRTIEHWSYPIIIANQDFPAGEVLISLFDQNGKFLKSVDFNKSSNLSIPFPPLDVGLWVVSGDSIVTTWATTPNEDDTPVPIWVLPAAEVELSVDPNPRSKAMGLAFSLVKSSLVAPAGVFVDSPFWANHSPYETLGDAVDQYLLEADPDHCFDPTLLLESERLQRDRPTKPKDRLELPVAIQATSEQTGAGFFQMPVGITSRWKPISSLPFELRPENEGPFLSIDHPDKFVRDSDKLRLREYSAPIKTTVSLDPIEIGVHFLRGATIRGQLDYMASAHLPARDGYVSLYYEEYHENKSGGGLVDFRGAGISPADADGKFLVRDLAPGKLIVSGVWRDSSSGVYVVRRAIEVTENDDIDIGIISPMPAQAIELNISLVASDNSSRRWQDVFNSPESPLTTLIFLYKGTSAREEEKIWEAFQLPFGLNELYGFPSGEWRVTWTPHDVSGWDNLKRGVTVGGGVQENLFDLQVDRRIDVSFPVTEVESVTARFPSGLSVGPHDFEICFLNVEERSTVFHRMNRKSTSMPSPSVALSLEAGHYYWWIRPKGLPLEHDHNCLAGSGFFSVVKEQANSVFLDVYNQPAPYGLMANLRKDTKVQHPYLSVNMVGSPSPTGKKITHFRVPLTGAHLYPICGLPKDTSYYDKMTQADYSFLDLIQQAEDSD